MTAQPADAWAGATRAADTAAPLDLLLADAALGPARRFLPGGAGVRFATGLARRPHWVARRATVLTGELARIGLGRSTLAASPNDRRFSDPAWMSNPLLRRLVQAYLAAGRTAEELLADADLEWRDAEQLRLTDNLVQALAPSNQPVTSPVFWKALIDSGGGSVVHGARHLAADLATPPRVPATVAADAFEVGAALAVTSGAVVLRTPVFELLQYRPRTPTVRRVPLLVVPPTINKYYIVDLAPGRSLVEYLVDSGQQVFVISWRNPDARHRDWGADTYGAAILEALEALEATRRTGRVDRSALLGLCSGGILTVMALAHLAVTGRRDEVAGFGLAVAVLDQGRAGTAAAALDEGTAQAAAAASAARGFLDGRALAEVFAWLRPGDLVWHYWVNNYLAGRAPPPFDIPYWNADTTRMPARLHRDFLRLAVDNALTHPGAAAMLGSPVDLAKVDMDAYVVAGVADHLCPWQACYRSTQLLGGRVRFVLSSGGHIASMVNPTGEPEGQLPDGAGQHTGPGRLAERGDHRGRLVVARLRPLAGAAQRRDQGPAPAARRREPPADRRCSRHLRPGPLRRRGAVHTRHRGQRPAAAGGGASRRRDPHPAGARQRHRRQPGTAATLRRRPQPLDRGGPLRRPRGRRLTPAEAPLPAAGTGPPGRPPPRPARLPDRGPAGGLLGRRPGPAVRPVPARPLPAAGAGRHRPRHADGARPPEDPGADGRPPPLPGPRLRRAGRRRPLRRDQPGRPRTGAGAPARRHPGGPPARLPLPARRRCRLDQPAAAALDPPADAAAGRRRRPDRSAGQRPDMRRLLPDAELHVYHGGHLGLLTEAAELAPMVDRFLDRGRQSTGLATRPARGGA